MRYWLAVTISGMGMRFMAGLAAAHSPWWWGGFVYCALCGAFWLEAEARTATNLDWHD